MVVVDLGEIDDPEERERYLQFLAENDIAFARVAGDEAGRKPASYTAQVALVGGGAPVDSSSGGGGGGGGNDGLGSGRAAVAGGSVKGARPSSETARMLRAVQEQHAQSQQQQQQQPGRRAGAASDFSAYGSFCALIETKQHQLQPRQRTRKWTLAAIADLYEERARLAHLAAPQLHPSDPELLRIFPVFVMDHLSKRYGLRRIVDQVGWDLVFNVHALRRGSLQVEMFARFLEEYYDENDLAFFLKVRAAVDRIVSHKHGSWAKEGTSRQFRTASSSSLRSSSSGSGSGSKGGPPPAMLRWAEVLSVAKTAYGSGGNTDGGSSNNHSMKRQEEQEQYQNLVDLVEEHCEVVAAEEGAPGGSSKADKRFSGLVISAEQLLHLAVAQFHDTCATGRDATLDEQVAAQDRQAALAQVFRNAQSAYQTKLKELGFAERRASSRVARDLSYTERLEEMCRAIQASVASRVGDDDDAVSSGISQAEIREWAVRMLGSEVHRSDEGDEEEEEEEGEYAQAQGQQQQRRQQRRQQQEPIDHPAFVSQDVFHRSRASAADRGLAASSSPPTSPPPPPPPGPAPPAYQQDLDRYRKARGLAPRGNNDKQEQEQEQEQASAARASARATPSPEAPTPTPTELVMNEIRASMDRSKDQYLESLMVAADQGLPPTVVLEIEKEVRAQLDRKSREILNDVIGGKANRSGHVTYLYESMPDACSASRLEADFRNILRAYNESEGSFLQMSRMVEDFCHSLLNSTELRQEIEPLVALLVTYASARLGNVPNA